MSIRYYQQSSTRFVVLVTFQLIGLVRPHEVRTGPFADFPVDGPASAVLLPCATLCDPIQEGPSVVRSHQMAGCSAEGLSVQ